MYPELKVGERDQEDCPPPSLMCAELQLLLLKLLEAEFPTLELKGVTKLTRMLLVQATDSQSIAT